ncbi:MAG: phosphoribosyltransferase [Candidatus Thorarchaeota archaeon]
MAAPYRNRAIAGLVLVEKVKALNLAESPLILAIPNGGIAVAVQLAQELKAELDILIVRKLQIPYNPEAGFGAVTSLGTVLLNEELLVHLGLDKPQIDSVIEKTRVQIETRKKAYAELTGRHTPEKRIVILVDDGLASGYTMLAAIRSVRELSPKRIIVAVPTASAVAASRMREVADDLICPHIGSAYIFAVADAYQDWYDVSDDEVIQLLHTFLKKKGE